LLTFYNFLKRDTRIYVSGERKGGSGSKYVFTDPSGSGSGTLLCRKQIKDSWIIWIVHFLHCKNSEDFILQKYSGPALKHM